MFKLLDQPLVSSTFTPSLSSCFQLTCNVVNELKCGLGERPFLAVMHWLPISVLKMTNGCAMFTSEVNFTMYSNDMVWR